MGTESQSLSTRWVDAVLSVGGSAGQRSSAPRLPHLPPTHGPARAEPAHVRTTGEDPVWRSKRREMFGTGENEEGFEAEGSSAFGFLSLLLSQDIARGTNNNLLSQHHPLSKHSHIPPQMFRLLTSRRAPPPLCLLSALKQESRC